MAPVSLYALYGDRLASDGHRLDPSARLAIEGGERITGLALQRAQMERTRLFRLVQDSFARFDVLAMPTLAATARSANHGAFEPLSIAGAKPAGPRFSWYPYTHAFNATGHPAISVPAGFGTDGLPVGLQLVGPWAAEGRLLRDRRRARDIAAMAPISPEHRSVLAANGIANVTTPLVLVPGHMCDAAMWAHQADTLGDVAEVTIADVTQRRICSGSGRTASSIEAPPRFALAGLSLGGYVCFEVMRQAPETAFRSSRSSIRPRAPIRRRSRRAGIALSAWRARVDWTRSWRHICRSSSIPVGLRMSRSRRRCPP